jgi:hypothetical protein
MVQWFRRDILPNTKEEGGPEHIQLLKALKTM